jgi:integrase
MDEDDDLRALVRAQAKQIELLTGLVTRLATPSAAPPTQTPAAVPGPLLKTIDLLDRWKDAKARLKSFACDYARAVRVLKWAPKEGRFAGITLGERDPMSLTPEDADAYWVYRMATTTRRKKEPSPALINREVMMLLRVLNFAATRKTIPANPIRGFGLEDENNAREVIIEEDGFVRIIEKFGDDLRMRALVTLGYDSAMRKTELLLCRRPWLDRERHQVHIPAAVAKNGEKRVADLTDRAWEAIEAQPRVLGTDLVFPNPETREPFDGRWIHELFIRAVDESGVTGRDGKPPRLHDLRRSWITLARRRGIPESEIMAKSGHKDHKVFRRYSIVDENDLQRSFEVMQQGRLIDIRKIELLGSERKGPHRANTDFEEKQIKAKKKD